MQTRFTPAQLKNPRLAEAESILRRCIHCGLCTATCPTYVLLGDERDSPRGRITLMRSMFESGKAASQQVAHHLDRCLSCQSCVTTCPSGVDYVHLVGLARAHVQETGWRSPNQQLARRLLVAIVPNPKRLGLALWGARLSRPFRGLVRAVGLKEIAAMLDIAPRSGVRRGKLARPGVAKARGVRRKRVALLPGCVQQVLRPEINDATIRLLTGLGVEVVIPEGQACCGAVVHDIGHEAEAHKAARKNVDAFSSLMRGEALDAIIINASGCGTMVKDYGHLLSRDQGYAERARRIVSLTKDVTEFLHDIGLGVPERWSGLRVAYHSACSMQHGQRIHEAPRALLRQAGYAVLDVPEGHICCGSAGTYNILQPEIANELRDRKIRNIESTEPDVVATGNIGCIAHLQRTSRRPVVHTVELLDWALGGACPKGLEAFAPRAGRVRDLIEQPDADAKNRV